MSSDSKAACVAVVGPANAGKTTLLHQLDELLNRDLDSFLILKGSPDGTGRYLYQAPDLREALKDKVKGKWGSTTVEQICESITQGRRNLSLALLDFGGRHDEATSAGNLKMLSCCSHYLLVTRDGDAVGAKLWTEVCTEQCLTRVAYMRSLDFDGPTPTVLSNLADNFEGTFQIKVRPGDTRNDEVLSTLAQRLRSLSCPLSQLPYVNLYRPERWNPEMVPSVGGEAEKINRLVFSTGVVVIGGHAPIWAYLAALYCAFRARPDARIFFFDPKQPQPLIEIPPSPTQQLGASGEQFPPNLLELLWRAEDDHHILEIVICSADKYLPAQCAQNLQLAPSPLPFPSTQVCLYGMAPAWIYGLYARWLLGAGVERLASWDAGTKTKIDIL